MQASCLPVSWSQAGSLLYRLVASWKFALHFGCKFEACVMCVWQVGVCNASILLAIGVASWKLALHGGYKLEACVTQWVQAGSLLYIQAGRLRCMLVAGRKLALRCCCRLVVWACNGGVILIVICWEPF